MRFITIALIIGLTSTLHATSQTITVNHCDSSILTQQEFSKCKADTLFNNDIIARINFIVFLKTELFPAYRGRRISLIIPEELAQMARTLKAIYDSTINHKIQKMTFEMDRNQKHVQPKAYISSLLALETLKFYPDTYAVLLNEVHLSLSPRTHPNQMQHVRKLVDKLYSSLSPSLNDTVQQITSQLKKDRSAYTKGYLFEIFQGSIEDDERIKYSIIDYLLWTE